MIEAPGWEYARYVDVLPRSGEAAAGLRDVRQMRAVVAAMRDCPLDSADVPIVPAETALQLARLDRLEGRPLPGLGRATSAAEPFFSLRYLRRGALATVEAGFCAIDAAEPGLASLHLKRAYEAYEAMGAVLPAAQVRRTLRSIGRMPPQRRRRSAEGELTARETEVATLARAGCSNAQIALALDISEGTVRTHMHNLLSKLGLRSRFELNHHSIPQRPRSDEPQPR